MVINNYQAHSLLKFCFIYNKMLFLLCRKYLKQDIIVSQDDMHGLIEYVVISVSSILMTFKQLVFLKDMKSSLKVRLEKSEIDFSLFSGDLRVRISSGL